MSKYPAYDLWRKHVLNSYLHSDYVTMKKISVCAQDYHVIIFHSYTQFI